MPRAGSTSARGYGAEHKRVREAMRPSVEAGLAHCWRCGRMIEPGTPWDAGHDDRDRRVYRGPEHASCNRSAAMGGSKAALRPPEPHPNRRAPH